MLGFRKKKLFEVKNNCFQKHFDIIKTYVAKHITRHLRQYDFCERSVPCFYLILTLNLYRFATF